MAEALSKHEEIAQNIEILRQKLLAKDPTMPQYLNFIHNALLQAPELTYILKDEERAVIFDALSRQTETVIISAASKKAGGAKGKGVTLLDLGL